MTKDCPDCQAREAEAKRQHAYTHCPECDKRLFFNLGWQFTMTPIRMRDYRSRECLNCGWKEVSYDDGEIVTTKGDSRR